MNQRPSEKIWMLHFGRHPIIQYSASYSFWDRAYSRGNEIRIQLAFHGGAYSRKTKKKKKSTQLSDRSSEEKALSNIRIASGAQGACLKVYTEMNYATCETKLCG